MFFEAPYRDSQSISSGAYGGGSASPLLPPIRNEPGASSAFSPIPRHTQHSGGPLPLSDAEGTEALRREVWRLRQQVDELRHQQQHQEQLQPGQRPLRESRPYSQNGASKTGDNRWHADQLFPRVTRAFSNVIQSSIQSDDHNKARSNLRTCAELSRKIKESQSGSITFRAFSHVGRFLPMPYRQEARRLAQAYFRTFESVYRILHVPAFRTRFEKYFDGQFDDQPDKEAFIVQLQLCMAIGLVFEDASGSLRNYQERWIQEGQSWLLVFPPTNLTGLQTMCLLHLAKEVCGFGGGGGELTYKSAGSLLREAMCLGLNKSSLVSMPIYQAELRRRLWATILEMVVQSSLDTGLPPGISLTELGTSPPANYDDEQLPFGNPVPRPSGTFTQTTVLLELHRSFPVRLAIAQHLATLLNPPNTKAPAVESGSTTESLNAELTRASRALTGTLQPGYDPAGILPNRISVFQLKMAEMLVNRFFLGLNLALAVSAETVYKPLEMEMPEVRTSCGAAAGTIWRSVVSGLGNKRGTGGSSGRGAAQHQQMDDFTTLVSRGSGTSYHATATVAVLTLLVELRRQMEEEWQQRRLGRDHQHGASSEANSTTTTSDTSAESTRQELVDLVRSAVVWTFGKIQMVNVDTAAYVWMYLLCSAAVTEVMTLQKRWETRSQHSTPQAETNYERQRTKQLEELVENRIVSDLNRVAGFLTAALEDSIHQDDEIRRDIEEDAQLVARNTNHGNGTGTGSGSGSERDFEMMERQKDGDSDALARRAADEEWERRLAETGKRQAIRFKSVFDLRNHESLFMQELRDVMA
ncbi:hypothetical protein N0V85_008433 [Neurospora sp. IMI 360204]|nr:hypothetical protein N0V85_008433 [Neurospora sp. IMI 360204]